ncbi:MAG: type III pantothenate kinase [Bdellovibrionales bacterium]|nr:type III pantothenate kinase [Bdellovibrionales bacterium]
MILCLDVGNTQIHGGVFNEDELLMQFRKTSQSPSSSDEYGLFLKSVLRENHIDPSGIEKISICTVVPDVLYSLRSACLKYFEKNPFVLQAGVKTGLKIKYRNPLEVGADRIANSVAACHLYPNKNIIIVDFGTATTICVINKNKEYLGGSILPGVRMSMKALESQTAKLPSVEITQPPSVIGRTTVESIQSGLFFGQMQMVKGMVQEIAQQEGWSGDDKPLVIGTGGFSSLFEKVQLFDQTISDLALKGLYLSLKLNM